MTARPGESTLASIQCSCTPVRADGEPAGRRLAWATWLLATMLALAVLWRVEGLRYLLTKGS